MKRAILITVLAIVAVVGVTTWAIVRKPEPTGGKSTESSSPLAGQWRGTLTANEAGETAQLITDLGVVSGRWTGQFDLPDFGVEDYPVDVSLEGATVKLQFTAAEIEFAGALDPSANAIAGVAEREGRRDSLVLRRTGQAQFSQEFLRLEALAEDSTRVESLSASGAELRSRFNQDKAYTRLLMLLSPT